MAGEPGLPGGVDRPGRDRGGVGDVDGGAVAVARQPKVIRAQVVAERRLLAFGVHVDDQLAFGVGAQRLTGHLVLWVDVGDRTFSRRVTA